VASRYKEHFTVSEMQRIRDADSDMTMAVIAYFLTKKGYSLDSFKDGWAFDWQKGTIEFG